MGRKMRFSKIFGGGLAGFAILLPSLIATQAAADRNQALPDAYVALIACRSIRNDTERLACLDQRVKTLEDSVSGNSVFIVDKAAVDKSRRESFGLGLSDVTMLDRKAAAQPIQQIESSIRSARQDGEGNWTVSLQDGTVWRQTDRAVFGRSPKPGMHVVVKRNGFGSYFMVIQNMPGVRARRVIP